MALEWPGVSDGGRLSDVDGKGRGQAGTGGGMEYPGRQERPSIRKPDPGPDSMRETGKVKTGNSLPTSEGW